MTMRNHGVVIEIKPIVVRPTVDVHQNVHSYEAVLNDHNHVPLVAQTAKAEMARAIELLLLHGDQDIQNMVEHE